MGIFNTEPVRLCNRIAKIRKQLNVRRKYTCPAFHDRSNLAQRELPLFTLGGPLVAHHEVAAITVLPQRRMVSHADK